MKIFTLLLFPGLLFAWGKIGHRIVGKVADHYLDKSVKERVTQLSNGQNLAQVSNWADFIKSDKEQGHTWSWHYINIPPGKTLKDINKKSKNDILWAIEHFKKELQNPKNSPEKKLKALSFLTHFVGDLHQPFHSGYKKDLGGNKFKLTWFGKKSNLHRVWDEHLIDFQKLSYTEYANFLLPLEIRLLSKKGDLPEIWIDENRKVLKSLYPEPTKRKLSYNYNYAHRKLLNERLYLAGLRLASILNSINI